MVRSSALFVALLLLTCSKNSDTNSSAQTNNTPACAATDSTVPTVGTLTAKMVDNTQIYLSWSAASDTCSASSSLLYKIVSSIANNVTTANSAETNGTTHLAYTATSATNALVTGLTAATTYYFNLLVKDQAGNIGAAVSVNATTFATAPTVITITGANGSSDYIFAATSGVVAAGNDQTLTLAGAVGTRFRITNNSGGHPFGLYNGGTQLLSQAGNGSLENDASVAWIEIGGTEMYFTKSAALQGQVTKYQCEIHPGAMFGTASAP